MQVGVLLFTAVTQVSVLVFHVSSLALDCVWHGALIYTLCADVRFLTFFSPCIWGEVDGYMRTRGFLHGTAVGRAIVNGFWNVLGRDVLALNQYDSHPETAKLKPWIPAMFTGTSFSILNYETDFFELARGDKIKIHVGEIDHLSPGKVHLADGTEFDSEVLLANTGWKHVPPIKFLPEGIDKELGLPHQPTSTASTGDPDLANRQDLVARADREIFARFPRLKNQPVWNKTYVPLTDQKGITADDDEVTPCKPLTPFMLYRFLVPPSARLLETRDVAFVGMVSNFSNVLTAHLQGLWVAAYFGARLEIDPADAVGDDKTMEKIHYETVLHNRFGKWRYPTDWAAKCPSFIFDAVPYMDLLLRDLGLDVHRKNGFVAEVWSPYGPEDYHAVNAEWLSKYGRDGAKVDS